eukprot:422359-Hanusia_phi.AAC.1
MPSLLPLHVSSMSIEPGGADLNADGQAVRLVDPLLHACGVKHACGGRRHAGRLLAKKGLDPFDDSARAGWKEKGESLSKAANSRVPDAITQTENTAKRQQNAAMRSRLPSRDVDEPEALRKMREERERREEEMAIADAAKRSQEKNFVSGQDLRESRWGGGGASRHVGYSGYTG